MITELRLFAVTAALVALPAVSCADDVVEQDYLACSRIVAESARLACYDSVSRRQAAPAASIESPAAKAPETSVEAITETAREIPVGAPAEIAPEVPFAAAQEEDDVAGSAPDDERFVPLTDDVGQNDLKGRGSDEPEAIRAQVTKCRLGATGKYYFYFENGQIWKQVDDGRQEFDDCDFAAIIKKDTFGYKMQPDIEARAVRIKLVK